MNSITKQEPYEYRKIQGPIGHASFAVTLPKTYLINLGIGKGNFLKVHQENGRIVLEKA